MALKLYSITFEKSPRIPGLRPGDMITIECENPIGAMKGWRALLRGPSLFLVSPPGWKPNTISTGSQFGEPSLIHEVPRSSCYFHWVGDDADVDKVGKFSTPPFGKPEAPVAAATVVGDDEPEADDGGRPIVVPPGQPAGAKSLLDQVRRA